MSSSSGIDAYNDSGPYSETLLKTFNDPSGLSRDFLEFICGERLGHGVSREVFVFRPDDKYVVKIEIDQHWFQNTMEAQVWAVAEQNAKLKKWFAPVKMISGCGRVLLMRKAEPLSVSRAPTHMPVCLNDTKLSNYGLIDNHPVAIDYGLASILKTGLTSRMKKVNWF